MKIGLVGPSYQQVSLPFDAQRTINLIPIADQQGKEVSSLLGTPGLSAFGTAGTGPTRGAFASANGRAFFVSGANLYEIDSGGSTTNRGTLLGSSGNVSIAENTTDLVVCDGTTLYRLVYSTNLFEEITDVSLPDAGTVTSLDGYIIVNEVDTGNFYISGLDDASTWSALDFANAESSPDNLVRVIAAIGQLWLLGEQSNEIWTNTGASAFPFELISGAKNDYGIIAPHTAVEIDNSLLWVGRDKAGSGRVYKTTGYTPQRISTEAIEIIIQAASSKAEMRSYTYEKHGHVYYVITGGGLETSLVYDLTTGLWHERAFLEANGSFSQHLAADVIFAFDKHLAGDRRNGSIYELSLDNYSDAGSDIARERIYTHLSDEDKRIRYNKLDIGVETGVGLQTGDYTDPLLSLQLSKDGARTWSDWYTTPVGKVGEYLTKVTFRRLGIAEQMTFKIRYTAQTKFAVTGSYIQ